MCCFFFFLSGGHSSFSAELSTAGDGDALSPSRSEAAELSTLEKIRLEVLDLAEIVEKVSGAIASKHVSSEKVSSMLSADGQTSKPASVSLANSEASMKRERLSAPVCSTANPIVISDDEGEDVTRVSPRSEKGSPRLHSKGAGASQVGKNMSRAKPKRSNVQARSDGVPNAESSSGVNDQRTKGL